MAAVPPAPQRAAEAAVHLKVLGRLIFSGRTAEPRVCGPALLCLEGGFDLQPHKKSDNLRKRPAEFRRTPSRI